jgi:hypothetical protein
MENIPIRHWPDGAVRRYSYGASKCIGTLRKMSPALKSVNVLSANPTGFVRSLGAFDEIYWLFSQTVPKGFAYAAEIEGRTTVDAWRKAKADY